MEVNVLVPINEPMEEDVRRNPAAEEDVVVPVETAISSTTVSPDPILVPVGETVCGQWAIKRRCTRVHPCVIDFTGTIS